MSTQVEKTQSYFKSELPIKIGKTDLNTESGPGHWHITVSMPQFLHE